MKDTNPPPPRPDSKEARLAQQLRANLRRRKAHTRGGDAQQDQAQDGDTDLSKEAPGR